MSVNSHEKAEARKTLRVVNPNSIKENVEYFFLIYKREGEYHSTTPISTGSQDSMYEDQFNAVKDSVPAGAKITACAHTHGKEVGGGVYNSENFSREDIKLARDNDWNAYLATPSSHLVILDHKDNRDQFPREIL